MSADRLLLALAALAGLLGVAASAAGGHGTSAGPNHLDTVGRFLLIHAAALVGIAALAAGGLGGGLGHPALLRIAGFVLLLGLALFCGDLTSRTARGAALFPFAAPLGGITLMIGWAALALAALWPRG